jgi:hypothetical protein
MGKTEAESDEKEEENIWIDFWRDSFCEVRDIVVSSCGL